MTISVVFPAHNEEQILPYCLEAFIGQTLKADEILVVNDGSTDRTPQIIQHFAEKYPYANIRSIRTGHVGIKEAFNAGMREAKSDVIVSSSGDIIVSPDYIERISHHFEADPELVGVTGRVMDLRGRLAEGAATFFAQQILGIQGWGGNSAYGTLALRQVGGYSENGTDIHLWNQIKNLGPTIYDDELIVWHDTGYNWRAWLVYPLAGALAGIGALVGIKNKALGCAIVGLGGGIVLAELAHFASHEVEYSVPQHHEMGEISGLSEDMSEEDRLLIECIDEMLEGR